MVVDCLDRERRNASFINVEVATVYRDIHSADATCREYWKTSVILRAITSTLFSAFMSVCKNIKVKKL